MILIMQEPATLRFTAFVEPTPHESSSKLEYKKEVKYDNREILSEYTPGTTRTTMSGCTDLREIYVNFAYAQQERQLWRAYLAAIFLSHYWYLGDFKKQLLFWLTVGGCGCWFIQDLLRMPVLVRQFNEKTFNGLLESVGLTSIKT